MIRKHVDRLLALACLALVVTAPRAQQPTVTKNSGPDRIALHQALLDLTNPWTVMCVAAHPDDEDGNSLIVMRRKYGAHTVSLFSTFGEGGQNAIGPELYEELGAIRARETMAASEIQGSEPYFLGLTDFGFSKSADETFRIWGRDEALRRMVLQIRKLRPDAIITNHDTSRGHGHHQATGRLVLEALEAAADPKRFPEQLKDGVTSWQVQRLFVRAGFGNRPQEGQPDNSGIVTIDPNERDPIRGTMYAEQALQALQKHATQGPWPRTIAERVRNSPDGRLPLIRYRLTREAKAAAPLPSTAHDFTAGLKLSKETEEALAIATGERRLPEFVDERDAARGILFFSGNRFARILTENNGAVDQPRLAQSYAKSRAALLLAMGITARLEAPETIVPGQAASFGFTISNQGQFVVKAAPPARIPAVLRTSDIIALPCCSRLSPGFRVRPGQSITIPVSYLIPADTRLTVPRAEHLYDHSTVGKEVTTAMFAQIGEMPIAIGANTRTDVGPPVEIASITPSPFVITPVLSDRSRARLAFTVELISHQSTAYEGELIATSMLAASRADIAAVRLAPGERKTVRIMVENPPAVDNRSSIKFSLSDVSRRVYVFAADARVTPNVRVGYIRGFDHSLPNSLAALGVESKELSVNDVRTGDLQKFTSIIVDNRVYESQPDLIAVNQRLLDYAKEGGTLIVFYHKSNEWNPDERRRQRPQLAPYKLILADDRITDENAPITFIEPQHPLLNFPNKLGQEDFAGWIQERGLYYPKEWDPQYHALLQSNDPGEQPLTGGLLVADYGRGHYVYSSMVWYRQLRAGVPGAYRMLANMISYGRAEVKR